MTVHIIENNLRENLGHFLNTSIGMGIAARNTGANVNTYANVRASRAVLTKCEATPLFRHLSWKGVNARDPRASMKFFGEAFFRDCQGMAPIVSEDLIIVSTALQNQIYGIARFLKTFAPTQKPRVAINFHKQVLAGNPQCRDTYIEAFDMLTRATDKAKVVLTGATDGIVEELSMLARGLRAELAPLPMYYGNRRPLPKTANEKSPVIAFLGRSLRRKGAQGISKLVRQLHRSAPRLRFIVQATLKAPASFFLIFKPYVKLRLGGLSPSAYFANLLAADIFLFPYSTAAYARRPSGIFADCAAYAGISVVPDGTWLACQIKAKKAAGWIYAPHQEGSLNKAVMAALDNQSQLQELANACGSYWWDHQSAEAYVRQVLKTLYNP